MKKQNHFKRILCVILSCLFLATSFAAVSVSAADTKTCAAYAVSESIVLDGQIDDVWEKATPIQVNSKRQGSATENLASAEVRVLWDGSTYMYVLANIKDSTKYTGSSTYNNDSFEVVTTVNGNKKQYRIGLDGATANYGWPWDGGYGYSETEDGWVAEYKIQLNFKNNTTDASNINVSKAMAVDFAYNDGSAEAGGRQAVIGWTTDSAYGTCKFYSAKALALGDNTIRVDGQIENVWTNATSYTVANEASSMTVKTLWDGSDYLYVLADIKDSTPGMKNASAWLCDSVEVRIMIKGTQQKLRVGYDGSISGWGKGTWPWTNAARVINSDGSWTAEYKIQLNCNQIDGVATSQPKASKEITIDFVYNNAIDNNGTMNNLDWSGTNCHLSSEIVEVKKAEITGSSITVGSDLSMNYYVNVLEPNIADQLSMRFTMNDTVETVTDSKIVDGEYVFAFDGIAPQMMCDNISAELLLNGNVIATQATNSVKANAQALLNTYKNDTTAKGIATVRFVTDMLYYGAAAQEYANYNVEALATDSVENMVSKAETTPNDSDKFILVGNTDSTLKIASASCLFDNVNKLCFKFYVGEGKADTLTITVGGKTVALSDCEDLGNGYYRFMTDAIYATDLDRAVVVVLNDGTNDVSTLTYSVNSYAYSMMNSTNTEMVELAMALYRYGMSADAYNAAN